jgi:hypothetical protein
MASAVKARPGGGGAAPGCRVDQHVVASNGRWAQRLRYEECGGWAIATAGGSVVTGSGSEVPRARATTSVMSSSTPGGCCEERYRRGASAVSRVGCGIGVALWGQLWRWCQCAMLCACDGVWMLQAKAFANFMLVAWRQRPWTSLSPLGTS